MAKLHVTWEKSAIGYNKRQRMTLKALGFRSLNQTIIHADLPAIRGMVNKVRHLVRVEEVADE